MTELLIIKPSSLGDIVHGLQVATSLRAQDDNLRISWVVRDIFAPIVRACEAVEHVYIRGREIPLRSRQTELLERYRKLPPTY